MVQGSAAARIRARCQGSYLHTNRNRIVEWLTRHAIGVAHRADAHAQLTGIGAGLVNTFAGGGSGGFRRGHRQAVGGGTERDLAVGLDDK